MAASRRHPSPNIQMDAARFYGKRDIRIDRIPVPECHADQVLIRPAYVGICGSDVHEYERGATLMPTTPHPLTGNQIPIAMGHEVSGIVEQVGSAVADLNVGQEVAIQPMVPDGTCVACRDGNSNTCRQLGFYGMSLDGGLARFMTVSRPNVIPLPKEVTLKDAALVEPLAVGWHAVRRSKASRGQSALVIGAGPIGLALILALKARGVSPIITSDMSSARRQAAKDVGADHIVDAAQGDVVEACLKLTNNDGVSVAFDAAGIQQTLDQAAAAVKPGGMIVNVAIWGGPASIVPNAFAMAEKTYTGSALYTHQDFDEVIEAIAEGKIRTERTITKIVKLRDLIEEGIHSLQTNRDEQIKILIAAQE